MTTINTMAEQRQGWIHSLKEKIAYEAQNLNMLKEKVAKLPF